MSVHSTMYDVIYEEVDLDSIRKLTVNLGTSNKQGGSVDAAWFLPPDY